jgi:glycosyltransferase involved in cell wall biosynthesis
VWQVKLSLIMPVYNREAYVGAALRSLLRQRDAVDLDIIVIDDGSTDGTAAVVRALIDETQCIRLFQQANGGVTKARNAGLGQLLPQTRLVSFLDSDDISPAERFKTDLACFDDDPKLELTYSLMTLVDKMDDETLEPAADSHPITVRGIHLSAGIFARALVDRIGAFDEEFEQAEDTDYLLRVFERVAKYIMPDTVALYYRRHPGNMTKEPDVPAREFMRAVYKSMKRRRADPGLRRIEGIFDLKQLADWRFW